MICSLSVCVLLRALKSVCFMHFIKKRLLVEVSFMLHIQGITLGRLPVSTAFAFLGIKNACDLICLLDWNVSLLGCHCHFVFLHRGGNISRLLCHFCKCAYFPVMELYDITRFHSYIHSFSHLLTHSFTQKVLWVFRVQSRDLRRAQNVESVHSHGFRGPKMASRIFVFFF